MNKKQIEKAAKEAKEIIIAEAKEMHDSGKIEVGERVYTFNKLPFKKAKRVYNYFSSVQQNIMLGNFMFTDSEAYEEIESLMFEFVDFKKVKLSTCMDKHFEEFPEDYYRLVIATMTATSYPFLKGITGK